ncbi:hypothetical protein tb265_28040 [Gemmatimonadetes bacterium T265]|nr:hypothetical protein tb265_28040 [Gemmatimonadetes bacterium T265]
MVSAPRIRRLVLFGSAAVYTSLTLACGESTAPGGGATTAADARFYRFVGDQFGSTTGSDGLGDLVLRPDGTFFAAVADAGGGLTGGHWDTTGTTLHLRPDSFGYDPVDARVSGDTIRTNGSIARGYPTITMFFVREPVPAATSADGGTYVLQSVNGVAVTSATAPPAYTTVTANARTVTHVAYDTMAFSDRFFVREVRLSVDTIYPTSAGPVVAYRGFPAPARYTATAAGVALRAYASYAVAPFDTLGVAGDTLIRRYHAGAPSQFVVERYVRLR